MGGIFLSHSHEDKDLVQKVALDLTAAGVVVWFDEAEMRIGDSLFQKIEVGITTMDYLAVFLSRHSIRSDWVQYELETAITMGIKEKRVAVLPILIEDCEVPRSLNGILFADLRDPRDYDDVFYQLLIRLEPKAKSDLEEGGVIDYERSCRMVSMALSPTLRDRIVTFLIENLSRREDPTQRYWLYISLGKIGGVNAQDALIKGLQEANEFARLGAEHAWQYVQNKNLTATTAMEALKRRFQNEKSND